MAENNLNSSDLTVDYSVQCTAAVMTTRLILVKGFAEVLRVQ